MWPDSSPAKMAPTSRMRAFTNEWPTRHISETPPAASISSAVTRLERRS